LLRLNVVAMNATSNIRAAYSATGQASINGLLHSPRSWFSNMTGNTAWQVLHPVRDFTHILDYWIDSATCSMGLGALSPWVKEPRYEPVTSY